MPSLGPAEILVILVVALLVFGPDKMPEIGRQLAKGVREFRRVQQHLSSELRNVAAEFDVDDDHGEADATPTPPRPGGDPVPTLHAKNGDSSDATGEASSPDPARAPSPSASSAPSPPQPSDQQGPGTDANGESPPARPTD
jgi:sec-independent protein translocase protein TatA